MPPRPPRRFANPRAQRRLAVALGAAAALGAGLATLLRDNGGASATYLIDALALVLAAAAAVVETRVNLIFAEFDARAVRRRALLFLLVGAAALLAGCVGFSLAASGGWARVLFMTALGGGGAAFLAGLGTLGAVFGGAYAADKVQERFDDEW